MTPSPLGLKVSLLNRYIVLSMSMLLCGNFDVISAISIDILPIDDMFTLYLLCTKSAWMFVKGGTDRLFYWIIDD